MLIGMRMMNECNVVVVVIGQINGGIAGHFFQSYKPSILWACLPYRRLYSP
jgi:hypothetical protein